MDRPAQPRHGLRGGGAVDGRSAKGITAGFKALAGGEVKQYTKLVEDSRRHALDRMIENARIHGANAIISMRFDSSEVGQSLTEIVAYGTAVVVGSRSG